MFVYRFHGLSFRAKYQKPVIFDRMMADIKETQLHKDDWVMPNGIFIISGLLSTVLERLVERGDIDDSRVHHFRTKFLKNMKLTLNRVMCTHGPLAIMCHGDFNRNNMMFRYDDVGRPVDALAFDFATIRYGSPVLDLSFFLYMNTNRRLREEYWDELLDTYCVALAEAVSDVADVVRVPDRSQLDAEMCEYGIYGLVHISFFRRIMMDENASNVDLLSIDIFDRQVFLNILQLYGGDKATDAIADAVLHYMNTYCNFTE